MLPILVRSVVAMATRRPHLHILFVHVLVGLSHQILVIVKDLWLLEPTMLFLKSLHLGKGLAAAHTLPRVEVLLVVLIVLQKALVDTT